MMSEGSYTFARSTQQAVSAPGWSSIICSLDPIDSGVTGNSYQPLWLNSSSPVNITPVSGDKQLPCVFEQIKKQKPEMKTTYIYDWDWLGNLNNKSIGYIDEDVFCDGKELKDFISCDNKYLTNLIADIKSKELGFAFYYIGELDEEGHTNKFCSPIYDQFIGKVDTLVGKVLTALEESGLDEETIVLLTSDHGAEPGTHDHGEFDDQNLFVLWAVKGPGVKENHKIETMFITSTQCQLS